MADSDEQLTDAQPTGPFYTVSPTGGCDEHLTYAEALEAEEALGWPLGVLVLASLNQGRPGTQKEKEDG